MNQEKKQEALNDEALEEVTGGAGAGRHGRIMGIPSTQPVAKIDAVDEPAQMPRLHVNEGTMTVAMFH